VDGELSVKARVSQMCGGEGGEPLSKRRQEIIHPLTIVRGCQAGQKRVHRGASTRPRCAGSCADPDRAAGVAAIEAETVTDGFASQLVV
jgi:hypothetical protein